jgi:hypothetical protein
MATAKTKDDSPKTITYVVALVNRVNGEKTPVTVPEYEVPILERIHGDQSIEILKEFERPSDLNASQAHAQLMSKYSQNHADVKTEYPRPSQLAKASGLPHSVGDDQRAKLQASLEIDHSEPDGRPLGSSDAADDVDNGKVPAKADK